MPIRELEVLEARVSSGKAETVTQSTVESVQWRMQPLLLTEIHDCRLCEEHLYNLPPEKAVWHFVIVQTVQKLGTSAEKLKATTFLNACE